EGVVGPVVAVGVDVLGRRVVARLAEVGRVLGGDLVVEIVAVVLPAVGLVAGAVGIGVAQVELADRHGHAGGAVAGLRRAGRRGLHVRAAAGGGRRGGRRRVRAAAAAG